MIKVSLIVGFSYICVLIQRVAEQEKKGVWLIKKFRTVLVFIQISGLIQRREKGKRSRKTVKGG